MHTTEEHTHRVHEHRQRRVDGSAAIAGAFTAVGVMAVLAALAAGAGLAYGGALDPSPEESLIAGAAAAVLIVFVAALTGGWAAGRMGRLDGGANGVAVASWLLLGTAVTGIVGSVLPESATVTVSGLPAWLPVTGTEMLTWSTVLVAVVMVVALFLGAFLGGRAGARSQARLEHVHTERIVIEDQTL